MALILTLAEAIDEKGLKATTKGNLPAKLVRHAYEVYKPFIQQSFLFTLFLLARYGDKVKPASFYTEHFMRAFPMVVFEAEEDGYSSAEDQVKRCYEWRCLNRFVQFFGLAEITVKDRKQPRSAVNIQKTPLLDQVVTFML